MKAERLGQVAHDVANRSLAESRSRLEVSTTPDVAVFTAVDAAIVAVLSDLDAILFPEEHPGHDPDHVYWQNHDPEDPERMHDPYQWNAETPEWIADWVRAALEEFRGVASPPQV